MKKLLVLLVAIGLSGCEGIPTKDGFDKNAISTYGHNVDKLVEQIGAPSSIYEGNDGGKIYMFTKHRTDVIPLPYRGSGVGYASTTVYGNTAHTTYTPPTAPPSPIVIERSCELRVKTDKRGVILSHTSQGNDCIAVDRTAKTEPAKEKSGDK